MQIIILLVILIAVATDLRARKIYNWLTIPALLLGLGWHFWLSGIPGLVMEIKVVVFCGIVFFLAFAAGGLGGGDVKLLAAVAALAGWPAALWICLWSAVCGGALALLQLLLQRGQGRAVICFLQNLWLSVIWRAPLPPPAEQGADKRRFPYSLAVLGGFLLERWLKS
ncbi:MAG: prepilin peptidase [Candidatus Margulisbacteria bacterium]|nr:prepilin peptidase [Candidatus Margulisiibacteriota bacterium]